MGSMKEHGNLYNNLIFKLLTIIKIYDFKTISILS